MKNYFIASLCCHDGILGGGIIADSESVTYKTGKVTVSEKYKNIKIKYQEINDIKKGWLLCFPTVSIFMKQGEIYKFIVFGRKRFCRLLESKGICQ